MDTSLKDEISTFVREHAEAQLKFVIDRCRENSYTYHAQGTNRVAEMILGQLEGLFPQHQVIEQTKVGNHHILRRPAVYEPPPLRSVCLLGHVDTVFPPEHPFRECRREGDAGGDGD